MTEPEEEVGPGPGREVKMLLLEELLVAMQADPFKIVMWEVESTKSDLTFYTLRFSMSGEAQARVDALAAERGVWAMGPAPE